MPVARAGSYVPLGAAERQRRALFLQSYRFSVDGGAGAEEGLRGRLLRRLREAVARWWAGAGLTRAWRGWRPRADHALLGCFGGANHHHKYYLHGYA